MGMRRGPETCSQTNSGKDQPLLLRSRRSLFQVAVETDRAKSRFGQNGFQLLHGPSPLPVLLGAALPEAVLAVQAKSYTEIYSLMQLLNELSANFSSTDMELIIEIKQLEETVMILHREKGTMKTTVLDIS